MDSFEKNGLHFNVLNAKSKTVSVQAAHYASIQGALSIPETVEHEGKVYTVTQIGGERLSVNYRYYEHIEDKRKKEGYRSVEKQGVHSWHGFDECPITSVKLPKTIVKIGDYAFYRCKSLSKVDLPSGLLEIGEAAFMQDNREGSLKSIKLPDTVKKIGERAFDNQDKLKDINIPTSLEVIEEHTFYGCDALKKIKIPANVNRIKRFAFGFDLEEAIIDNSDDNLVVEKDAFPARDTKVTYKGKGLLKKILGK